MPILSMFYGIIVSMYFLDNKRHHLPHVHVKYHASEAVFSVPDGKLIEGALPAGKMRLVEAWIELHQEELLANWILAENGQPLFRIEPLK